MAEFRIFAPYVIFGPPQIAHEGAEAAFGFGLTVPTLSSNSQRGEPRIGVTGLTQFKV
jgi:hypothetical protein